MTLSRTSATAALIVLLVLALVAEPAAAERKRERGQEFRSGKVYRGSFPDPDVLRLGRRWVAVGTTVAGRSLPMMTSRDGKAWRARTAHGHGRRRTNDGMVGFPAWAARRRAGHHRYVPIWAPAIGRAGRGRWLVAYAAPLRRNPARRCVGIARARTALGPYRNVRRKPLVCLRHQNVIDPDLFRARGRTYLLWKTGGIWGRQRTAIKVRALRKDGRGFRPGSRAHTLLRTGRAWEGPVIENPSMIRYRGRLYLFYSGNRWYSRHYAVGYAVCRSVLGPCGRVQHRALLTSGRGIAGPGGQSAVRGPRGRLLLAYAAWPAGRVGHQRRLHIAELTVRHRRLVVARHHWRPRARRAVTHPPAPAAAPAVVPAPAAPAVTTPADPVAALAFMLPGLAERIAAAIASLTASDSAQDVTS